MEREARAEREPQEDSRQLRQGSVNLEKHTGPSSVCLSRSESKSAPAKKISNAAKAKQMSETERSAQVQALEKAREVDHSVDTWSTDSVRSAQRAALPLKPAPNVGHTALHVSCIGAQRQSGKMRWRRFWTGTDQRKCLRSGETWPQNINFLHEDRYLQGHEDDLDILVNALKKSDKHDKDRPHLWRAFWRRKRARRRHVDRQKKSWNAARRSGHLTPSPSRSISIGIASSGTLRSRKLSLISTAPPLSFQTQCRVQTLRQAEDEHRKW